MTGLLYPINDERNHPIYGGCDGFGPNGDCSVCTGKIERIDGSIIDEDGRLLRRAPLRVRLRRAWLSLRGGAIGAATELLPPF